MGLFKMANVITGAGPDDSKGDEGASLTTVLETPALRIELALLVLLCADAMRSDLVSTFDPDKTHETNSNSVPPLPPRKPVVNDLISFDESQDEASVAAQKARRSRQQEVESTQMQSLRRSALTFFDNWRAGVLNRLCEVLCLRGEVVRQAKTKRMQAMAAAERSSQTDSQLLIDFGGDPFADRPKANRRKHGFYDTIENKLMEFEEEKRVLILHCLLLLLLSLENYTAHSRVLLVRLAGSFGIEVDVLNEHEKSVAQGLLTTVASRMDADESTQKQAANDNVSKKWKIGLAAVGGAVLIGVTGGLAAPLLAAGVGTVMGGLGLGAVSGLLGTLAGSSVLVGSLFGAYGGKMTGRIMKKYAREVEDFEFIPIRDPDRRPSAQSSQEWSDEQDARDPFRREQHRLRVSIGISGWLNSPSDVNKPWEVIDPTGTEPFSLRFEMDSMLKVGNSLNDVLYSYAWDGATYAVVRHTLLGALYAGLWPLGLVKAASVLDNPFSVAIARADKAGKVMARALMDKVQGERPVTLMGYSIGARVIYSCLVELAEQHSFGLVESVIIMGAPVPSDTKAWRQIRSVVTGRVVNVFSTEDYILGFLYRSTKLQMGVAGLQELKDVSGIENVDMSKTVNGHDKYRYLVGNILAKVGFGDVDFNKVAEQERALDLVERKKQQVREEVRKNEESKQADAATREKGGQKPDTLLDLPDATPERAASFPVRNPIMQQRSGQQPMMRRPMTTPISRPEQEPSSSNMDPLSGNIFTSQSDAAPSSSRAVPPATFAARGAGKQIPSNMIPTPAALPQQTNFTAEKLDSDDGHRIQMVDSDPNVSTHPPQHLDTQQQPSSLSSLLPQKPMAHAEQLPKLDTSVQGDVDVDSEAGEDTQSDNSESEMGSQFGELSMVEPVPFDVEY